VVLYAHPLLGEGLASLLTAQVGVGVTAIDHRDAAACIAALALQPDLVIVEETDAPRPFETMGSMPVVFVRVDASGDGRRLGAPLADPDAIVALARDIVAQHGGAPA
jgi:hypothetical protein